MFAHDHLRRQEIALLTDNARRDALTGLLNRRGFQEAFDAELERARRSGSSLSVVVGDLDRFKRVNDALGHPGGDAALTPQRPHPHERQAPLRQCRAHRW